MGDFFYSGFRGGQLGSDGIAFGYGEVFIGNVRDEFGQ